MLKYQRSYLSLQTIASHLQFSHGTGRGDERREGERVRRLLVSLSLPIRAFQVNIPEQASKLQVLTPAAKPRLELHSGLIGTTPTSHRVPSLQSGIIPADAQIESKWCLHCNGAWLLVHGLVKRLGKARPNRLSNSTLVCHQTTYQKP